MSQCSLINPFSNLNISKATCSPAPAKLYIECNITLSLSWKLLIFLTVVFTGALFNPFTASKNAFLPVANERLCWIYESFNNDDVDKIR